MTMSKSISYDDAYATVPEFRAAIKFARDIVMKNSSSRRRNGQLPAPSIYLNPVGITKDPERRLRYAGTWGGSYADELVSQMNAFFFMIGRHTKVYATQGGYVRGLVQKNSKIIEESENNG